MRLATSPAAKEDAEAWALNGPRPVPAVGP